MLGILGLLGVPSPADRQGETLQRQPQGAAAAVLCIPTCWLRCTWCGPHAVSGGLGTSAARCGAAALLAHHLGGKQAMSVCIHGMAASGGGVPTQGGAELQHYLG